MKISHEKKKRYVKFMTNIHDKDIPGSVMVKVGWEC